MFVAGMRASFGIFKNAAGIFYEDRYIPILEAVINLVVSIPLAFMLGLKGVLLGTICSNCLLYIYSYRKYVYGKIFEKDGGTYCKDLLKYLVLYVVTFIGTALVHQVVNFDSVMVQLFVSIMVSAIVPNIIIILFNYRTDEFAYVWGIVRKVLPIKINK
jgi:O-antigen/teichoic acid export membrane protein